MTRLLASTIIAAGLAAGVSFAGTAPAKAADWMAGEFAKKNIQVQRAGDTLRGTDKDGADFTISFEPAGDASKGEVRIVKN